MKTSHNMSHLIYPCESFNAQLQVFFVSDFLSVIRKEFLEPHNKNQQVKPSTKHLKENAERLKLKTDQVENLMER